MRSLYSLAVLLLINILPSVGQRTYIDRAPSGERHIRAVEGGGMVVPIDTVTALDTLLQRLNKPWQFVETGKGYWIGYTDDMYSIAARGEAAIEPLLRFLRTTANERGKTGAVYCLHLIGIDSRIAGRNYEEFFSKKARAALLAMLQYPSLIPTVTYLLLRDPWQSDVPYLLAQLHQPSAANWALVNAIKFYHPSGLPIHQDLPAAIASLEFDYPRMKQHKWTDDLAAIEKGEMSSADVQVEGIIQSINAAQLPTVRVEPALLSARQFWGNRITEFGCTNCIGLGGKKLELKVFLNELSEGRVNYYLEGETLTICTAITAEKRLLSWWGATPTTFKESFSRDKALRRRFEDMFRGF